MTTPRSDDEYAAALDQAEQLLGVRLEPFLVTSEAEPPNADDFMRISVLQAFGDAWPRSESLDVATRALVSVTIAAVLGTLEPLRGQLRIALNAGVTREQIVEAFIQIAAYAGVARAYEGYAIAAQVFAERFKA